MIILFQIVYHIRTKYIVIVNSLNDITSYELMIFLSGCRQLIDYYHHHISV